MMNGQPMQLEVAPQLDGNTTMVPIRFIGEGMGAKVTWNAANQTATLTMQGKQIDLKIGSSTAMVNGKAVALDAPLEINNGSTMVPLRFVGETFDQKVDFDNATKKITLTDEAAGQEQKSPAQKQKSPFQVAVEKLWLDTWMVQTKDPQEVSLYSIKFTNYNYPTNTLTGEIEYTDHTKGSIEGVVFSQYDTLDGIDGFKGTFNTANGIKIKTSMAITNGDDGREHLLGFAKDESYQYHIGGNRGTSLSFPILFD
jgi:hypothetical protein